MNVHPYTWNLCLENEHLLFLGEIPNMPGHCAVVDKSGRVHYGWDIDNFIELTEKET